jgi:Phage integrase central domain/Arm DNA-binding domain
MAGAEKLSATKVAKLKEPGRYGDGRGLWFHVGATGGRSWVLRFMRNGTAREMGLGPFPDIGLAAARQRAIAARQLILGGIDPIDHRRECRAKAKADAGRVVTFQDAAGRYIAAQEAGWRNPVHRRQWAATLKNYVYPALGSLPVGTIDTALVLQVLEPIWTIKPETAGRVRGRIEAVLDWATARKFRHGDNPARWRGHLDKLLPAKSKVRTVRHHAALPYDELPAFMHELRLLQSIWVAARQSARRCAA